MSNTRSGMKADLVPASIEGFSSRRRAGLTTSVEVLEMCISRALDPDGEGKRTFVELWADAARDVSRSIDGLFERRYFLSPIAGAPISVKNLLDVEGYRTQAASKVLERAAPAAADAEVVARLKRAGAVLIGSTTMTEFAYSVVGLNERFGTPSNPWDKNRIPGGSSSGAAVSVASGMALGAIGSDTVGSIRVPSALCGIVGMKPTQSHVPLTGSIPLSNSLDSLGPMATTVRDCAALFAVMSGKMEDLGRRPVKGLRLAIPSGIFLEGLDEQVGSAFERVCTLLNSAGATVSDADIALLSEVHAGGGNRIIQSVEAFAWHQRFLPTEGQKYDPAIRRRIELGASVEAVAYARMMERRRELMSAYDSIAASYDALILPTVAVIAPTLDEAARREDELRTTLLRNTGPFNFLDCCAISIPMQERGKAPTGLMVVGRRNHDWHLLSVAEAIEETIRSKEVN